MVIHLDYDIAELKLEMISENLLLALIHNSDPEIYAEKVSEALIQLKQMVVLAEKDKDPETLDLLNIFVALVEKPTGLSDSDMENVNYLCEQISFRTMIW